MAAWCENEIVGSEEEDCEPNYGYNKVTVHPYQFEPVHTETANDLPTCSTPSPPPENRQADRLGNTDWCTCGACKVMDTQTESVCCAECPRVWRKVVHQRQLNECQSEEGCQKPECITEVYGFEPVCLNPCVLETAYLQFTQVHDVEMDTTQSEKYRYTAYRQLVRWCYGFLGRSIRVPLPSCVVSRIRTEYPSDGQSYKGFKWPHL